MKSPSIKKYVIYRLLRSCLRLFQRVLCVSLEQVLAAKLRTNLRHLTPTREPALWTGIVRIHVRV